MITHAVSVEVVHLFLYRTIDAGVTRMQAHDELSLVVELFHQCKLFFQIHGSGAADCCARFGAKCQFAGHEAASLTLGVPMCFITVLLGWGTSIVASSSAV